MDKRTALVIGGSSGLGLELGLLLAEKYEVVVTGRRDPSRKEVTFVHLDLDSESPLDDLNRLKSEFRITLLVHAAGFYQEGTIGELHFRDIQQMINVGLLAPMMLISLNQKLRLDPLNFIAITSTSQWTPRQLEPVYTAVKAGLAMFANSLSLDPKIGKVLVAGPAGMATRFWEKNPRDMSSMLDPKWVAEQILQLYEGDFKYKFAKIMRDPPRVEVVETR